MTKYNKAIIVCTANLKLKYDPQAFYIATELGCISLIENKIRINVSLGDFDSVASSQIPLIKKHSDEFIKYPSEKDYIDGELAIFKAKELKFTNIEMYLPVNNRIDMGFSSYYFANRYNVKLYVEGNLIMPLKNQITIPYSEYKDYKYLSIIPIVDSKVRLDGLKYGEHNRICNLPAFTSNGCSDELIVNVDATIEVMQGECVLFFIK